MSNKQFLLIPVAAFLFLSGLYLGYGLGAKEVNDAANHRAIQMIQNNEISQSLPGSGNGGLPDQ